MSISLSGRLFWDAQKDGLFLRRRRTLQTFHMPTVSNVHDLISPRLHGPFVVFLTSLLTSPQIPIAMVWQLGQHKVQGIKVIFCPFCWVRVVYQLAVRATGTSCSWSWVSCYRRYYFRFPGNGITEMIRTRHTGPDAIRVVAGNRREVGKEKNMNVRIIYLCLTQAMITCCT